MLHVDNTRRLPAPEEKALALLTEISSVQVPVARPRQPVGAPWITSFLTTLVVVMGCALFVQHLSLNQTNAASAVAPPPTPAPVRANAMEETPYPFAEFVKVSGVKMVMDLNRRAQLQYVVVNRSDSTLSNIGLKITVRPFFTVAAIVPLLRPHESKEMRTDLDSELSAEVQVISQQ